MGDVTAPCITPMLVSTYLPSISIDVEASMLVNALTRDPLMPLLCIVSMSFPRLIESNALAKSMNSMLYLGLLLIGVFLVMAVRISCLH